MSQQKYEDILDFIHTQVHSLRLIPNYKPTPFEYQINKIISELYSDICLECQEKFNKIKYSPEPQQQTGFLRKLFG